MLATLIQQWASRYIRVTQSPYSPHKQARIRAFFAEGANKFHLPWAVEALPALLHLSLFLFFAGLSVLLFNMNRTVFDVVICWVGFCGVTYLCITLLPVIFHDSPYYSPLSSSVWSLCTCALYIVFKILRKLTAFGYFSYAIWEHFLHLENRYRKRFLNGMRKAAEESALRLSPEIDGRALAWTLESLDGDPKQEQLFAGILDFCKSAAVTDSLGIFKAPTGEKMSEILVGLMHHTLSSKLAPDVKLHRIEICRQAMNVASLPITWPILQRVIYEDWDGLLKSIDFGLFLTTAKYSNPNADYHSKCVVAVIIATVQEHDDRWFELASCQLRMPRAVLEGYLTQGDSVLLANCINICQRTIQAYSENDWAIGAGWRSKSLEIVSKLDAQNTRPGLQHDFCRLWNELIRMTKYSADRRMPSLAVFMLRHIRNIYIDLHQDTTATPIAFSASTDDYANALFYPSSYPLCNIPDHQPHSPEVVVDQPGGTVPTPATTFPTVPRRDAISPPVYEPSNGSVPDAAQCPTSVPVSSHPPERLEGNHQSAASRDVAARGATQGNIDSLATSPAASASISLQAFASPSSNTLAPSAASGMSPPFPPTTAPSHTPSAGFESFSATLPSQFSQAPSVPAIPLTPPQATSVPIEASCPHQSVRAGPDIAADLSRRSSDAAPFPHDIDRSR